jgi:hypothetical protein
VVKRFFRLENFLCSRVARKNLLSKGAVRSKPEGSPYFSGPECWRRSGEHVCDPRPWSSASGDPLINLTQTVRYEPERSTPILTPSCRQVARWKSITFVFCSLEKNALAQGGNWGLWVVVTAAQNRR